MISVLLAAMILGFGPIERTTPDSIKIDISNKAPTEVAIAGRIIRVDVTKTIGSNGCELYVIHRKFKTFPVDGFLEYDVFLGGTAGPLAVMTEIGAYENFEVPHELRSKIKGIRVYGVDTIIEMHFSAKMLEDLK